jgi:valyl-tRNA synthetase
MYDKERGPMLEGKYNFTESEKKWQDYWQGEGIYEFEKDSDKPVFSIDTPPPTVNGKIHIGHIFSYTQAEIMARYMRMKGNNVFYPFGFDDNGLPTERLVEKNNNIKAHEVSREEFTNLCLETTSELEKEFRKLFISAGFSCDWNYQYSTISKKAQLASQRSFLDLQRKGKVYYSNSPAIWCTECNTAIAQAELESKEIPSIFNYLRFDLDSSEKYIEIATTRPELLPACLCIFVNPKDSRYINLLGKNVRVPIFDFTVPILVDDKVDMEKGTGIVMCCTFGDLTDLEWYKKHKLEYKEAILEDGKMSKICGKYEGLYVKKARKLIIEDLIDAGYMIKQEEISHNVSTHERCGTPMEITIKKQWFIDILSEKQRFIDAGNEINWYPEHMKNRYLNWVENLEWDWCISRQRYFGVPFPVWYCKDCGEPIFASEDELPVNPLTTLPKHPCKCGCTEFIPEKDILDTWATSSITPLINAKWGEDDNLMDKIMPMSLRPNAHDIIRTWDFYTIVKNLYHMDKLPWENVMISGHVMASKEEKISKRKSNSKMEPTEIIKTYSADAIRCWAAMGSLGSDIVFSEGEIKNSNKLINKLWNASKFVLMHLEDYKYDDTVALLPMDQWIIAKYNEMFRRYRNYLEKYEIGLALKEAERFFWNFCDNYIEIVKNRLYKPEIYSEASQKSGQIACYQVLLGIIKCFAIYMPHITEEVYKNFFERYESQCSIHLTLLQQISEEVQHGIIESGDMVVEIISQVRKYKSENNVSLKTELDKVDIYTSDMEFVNKVDYDIKATCNCLKLNVIEGNGVKVEVIN